MRFLFIPTLLIMTAAALNSQSAIFLHHSTGEGVFLEGKVAKWISNYNTANNTKYSITERSYPNTPYPWENYPFDYWNLWVNNKCNATNSNIHCLSNIVRDYDMVIFKHCFPGAGIGPESGPPSVSSSTKTIGNYKLQYRALRALMDQHPTKKFIVWTLAPLHRLETTTEEAKRAREFVNWVKSEWLTEDGKSHPNIFIFDFFGLLAESSSNPKNGKTNCLKYEYEKSHSVIDSHPNTLANETVGPVFAQFIVNTFKGQTTGISVYDFNTEDLILYPNPVKDKLNLDLSGISFQNNSISVDVFTLSGNKLLRQEYKYSPMLDLDLTGLAGGTYILRVKNGKQVFSRRFSVAGL